MKKHPRNIEMKSLFNEPEYSEFRDTCHQFDISQSRGLREGAKLLRTLLDSQRNGSRATCPQERPGYSHNLAVFLPGRSSNNASFASRAFYARN